MECNKDEAVRAKEIAERKFTERNYSAAKKFILKAQNLYPGLDGLSQMMTTLEVYISAENKINGEMDWYGILGVNHLADDENIRRQYRKLALVLHPDKNKSLGAEGAFKLVSEAWSLLSDKGKRLAYNQKRDLRGGRHKTPTHTHSTSVPPSANGFQNFNNVASNARNVQSKVRVGPTSLQSSHRKPDTFWTLCNRCKTHYEYLRVYLNHTLLCPNCHEAFLAVEKAPPPNVFKSPSWSSQQQHQNSKQHSVSGNVYGTGRNAKNPDTGHSVGGNSVDNTNFQCGPSSRAAGVGSNFSSASAHSANVVQQASEKVKRDRDETQLSAEERSHLPSLKKKRNDDRISSYGVHMANQMARGDGSAGVGLHESRKSYPETQKFHGLYGPFIRANSQRELSIFEIRNMLIEKARTEIRKKLEVWSSLTEKSTMNKQSKKQKNAASDETHYVKVNGKSSANSKGWHDRKKPESGSLADNSTGSENVPVSINVPDPDFHNFDLDRAESSFGDDQVWACYDDDDGMPRFYARIYKVISLRPFRMRISWLNSRSNTELGPMDWIGSGFTKTCGDFRIGRHETTGSLNSFSHKVCWVKGLRGAIRIFPQKGEVWAVYRNWSVDWNKDTPEEMIHKYDMVEVLDDFNEDQGVSVAPLVKVVGFRTVFRKHMDPKEVRKIPKEEMFRFSHQVPNYLLTGEEAQNAPKGCRELDPAATPLELLQIDTESNQATAGATVVKTEEEISHINQETVANEVEDSLEARRVEIVAQDDEQTKISDDVSQGS
ncbi:uncharacterized protein LOC111024612 [Momordica charantia]|uniref:Uncharacterized protein LOC111024612 n=1 Tax=Momordica charantia TaxID=3673 RepID=A0A6J1DUY6_MOMCH|nr:uncharacterized protein LOC111024612 [Momordica charantia]XP_022158023.1 uncharacterized protein LOC111024612 [Momordica charantia]XP_022158024.1 uncharacterized protein LOC111024612 [Momordica charantia]XP_022158025.1 uncharacterized protein LOC111024612 [Momordica charantia]XP_022158026.1 uncharacterized protein LOC111024612 [Momordica charantia]